MELDDDIYRDLVGICMEDNTKLPYITTKVKVDDIPNNIYKTIYKTIYDLYKLGVDVNIVTVSNRLLNTNKLKEVGGRSLLNEITLSAPPAATYRFVVNQVIEQTTFRKVSSIVEEFKKDISTSSNINSTTMEYCSELTNIVNGTASNEKVETISTGYDEVLEDLYTSRDNRCIGVDSGFSSLNYYLGGFQPSKLYIIGARPSMGKSALAMNIAEYVAKDKNVLFISLEMSKKEYAQRLMFSRAEVDISTINTGRISDEEICKIKEQKNYLDSLNLFVQAKTPCRVSDIELAIINLQATKGSCDLVAIDYLQLLSPSGKGNKNRENDVAEISRDLKALAIKYNVPIIVLSQLSRALEAREDKRPMLQDLRESGAIEQDADVVMFVYRDEYYNPDDAAVKGNAEVLIRKNRGGINYADIKLLWRPTRVRFMEGIKV